MKDILLNLKHNFLVDVISAITIIDVEENEKLLDDLVLYIATDSIETVDEILLEKICKKHSNKVFTVEFLMPQKKSYKDSFSKKDNIVCIFIKKT